MCGNAIFTEAWQKLCKVWLDNEAFEVLSMPDRLLVWIRFDTEAKRDSILRMKIVCCNQIKASRSPAVENFCTLIRG